MTDDWTYLPTVPAILPGDETSADVLVLVEFSDGRRGWLQGRMVQRFPKIAPRWQVATPGGCTILAWMPGPEIPKAKEKR